MFRKNQLIVIVFLTKACLFSCPCLHSARVTRQVRDTRSVPQGRIELRTPATKKNKFIQKTVFSCCDLALLIYYWFHTYFISISCWFHLDLKCIQNNDDRELLGFALTAVIVLNKLTDVRAKVNSSLSSLFWIHFNIDFILFRFIHAIANQIQ